MNPYVIMLISIGIGTAWGVLTYTRHGDGQYSVIVSILVAILMVSLTITIKLFDAED
jgi:hypothetical protein